MGCLKLTYQTNDTTLKVVYGGLCESKKTAQRFYSLDPRPNISLSPYAAFKNNPILFSDPMGDTSKLYGIGEKGGIYNQIGAYDDGRSNITRYAVDQKSYEQYKNSDAGKAALKNSEKDFVNGLTKYLDQQETANKGSNYIARETGTWEASFTGTATVKSRSVHGKKITVTEVEKGNGTFSVFSLFDDGGKSSVLSQSAKNGAGDYGAIPNGKWYMTNSGRLRNYAIEPQFFTEEYGTMPNGDDYVKDKFGFTFDILPRFKTQRGNIRLHPDGFSTGCITLVCTPNQARTIYSTINSYMTAHGKAAQINLNVDLQNNEKAVSIKPK